MKLHRFLPLLLLLAVACAPKKDDRAAFVSKLMKQMTLEEKLGQLNLPSAGDITTGEAENNDFIQSIRDGKVGGLFNIKGLDKIRQAHRIAVEESRMHIPLMFGMDVIHGYETVFPIPLGLAATWDMEAVESSARIAAIEASAAGINWTFSPMVDICRDPRWGRIAEGSGEDAYLGSRIAEAMVRGYQGTDLAGNTTIMACVKHFALYGASEAGRDYNTVDMSRIRMYNEYLPPYKAAVDAGAGSVMASFNEIDGIPATANHWLLTTLLRDEWGFKGFVVSDYTGISEMIEHGMGDLETVSSLALKAGNDMDMVSQGFISTLGESLRKGNVTEKMIDDACRRILEAKYDLGLFEDPYRYCDPGRAKTDVYTASHRAEARRIASESFVLLKNDNSTLPLKQRGTIAVVGPLANSGANMAGTWSVAAKLDTIRPVVEGIRDAAGKDATVLYALGSRLSSDAVFNKNATMFGREFAPESRSDEALLAEALAVARRSDVIVAVVGESSEMSGEASSRTNLDIPDTQREMLKALAKTGKPIVVVLFAGRPMTINWEQENLPAILNVWFGGTESADAIADVLFGRVNPCGKLPVTFPKNVGQIPLFYNHKNTGRPLGEGKWFSKFRSNYMDVDNDPLYPFGYGLSYTTFKYGELTLSAAEAGPDATFTATIPVTNTGSVAGKEVVQLYIRDLVGSVTRPVKELKAFSKIELQPGETKQIHFNITPDMLMFYNSDLKFVSEPGDFVIMVGPDSRNVQSAKFTLKDK